MWLGWDGFDKVLIAEKARDVFFFDISFLIFSLIFTTSEVRKLLFDFPFSPVVHSKSPKFSKVDETAPQDQSITKGEHVGGKK